MADVKKFTVERFKDDEHGDAALDLAWELILNIRRDDEAELEAVGDPVLEIYNCLRCSEVSYVYRNTDGVLLCIAGVGYSDNVGKHCVWMLGTVNLEGYVRTLLVREAKRLVAKWTARYGTLCNCVYEKSEKSVRYLKMLGANFAPVPVEINGHKFFYFEIKPRK